MATPASIAATDSAAPRQEVLQGPAMTVAVVVFAAVARAIYWNQRPPDMTLFLEPWFNHILHYGPVAAFAHPFSNYEPAYLYLMAIGSLAHGLLAPMTIIKILSVAGTVFLTLAVADVLKAAKTEARAALVVLVLPSIVMNDALLGQCDALWAGSCVFALGAMMRGWTLRSLVWCGVAISFKLQAAFIAPVIIGAMVGRRPPLWQWTVPALVFLASLVPAWLAGWPAMKLLTVYFGQAALDQIPGCLTNPWMLAGMVAGTAARHWFLLGYAAAAAAAVGIAALAARGSHDRRLLLLLGALSATALPFLLPKMLERYYFLGDVLTLAVALAFRNRAATVAALGVQIASVLGLMTYIYQIGTIYPVLAGAAFASAALVAMISLIPGAPRLLSIRRSAAPLTP